MAKYIDQSAAIEIIEEKQKELCPVGRYGRGYVYGSDREKYDAWDEIIDALDAISLADVAPVVHGRWIDAPWLYYGAKQYVCSRCRNDKYWRKRDLHFKEPYCPNCGAKMDGGGNDEDN